MTIKIIKPQEFHEIEFPLMARIMWIDEIQGENCCLYRIAADSDWDEDIYVETADEAMLIVLDELNKFIEKHNKRIDEDEKNRCGECGRVK